MTLEQLRDEFAGLAMAGMLASWDRGNAGRVFDVDALVIDAYVFADAMLHQRRAYCPLCHQKLDPDKGVIVHESGCEYAWPTDLPPGE